MAAQYMTTPPVLIVTLALALAVGGCQNESPNHEGGSPVDVLKGGAGEAEGSGGGGVDTPDNPLLAMTDTTTVGVCGESFTVALALDQETRVKGLGDVPDIPADRGMLFVFPRNQHLGFVMRDCLVDIDIAFLSETGRVGRMHTMVVDPKRDDESQMEYEFRLIQYRSGFPARMALELRAGTLERLGVSIGDQLEFEDLDALKKRAE